MRALIAGGGIGGISAALCLARDGHDVAVYEQAPSFEEVGAGIQVSPNCSRVLHYLGLEGALRAKAFLPEGTQFRHWKHGGVISEQTLGRQALEQYGYPYYHIHRGDLLRILVDAAKQQANISLHPGCRVTGCAQDTQQARLATDSGEVLGDLIIGADGIRSVVREALWGATAPVFTGNVAWRALVPADRLPPGLVRPMSTVWWGPKRHFVHYYVRGGALVNCVCVVEKTGWEVESWTEAGELCELRSDFAGWHTNIQTLIDNMDTHTLFKWALHDRPPMSAWGKGRITLLGDACHPTLPFMAQGAAMAVEDGAVLAACLRVADDTDAALARYEAIRRARTAGVQLGSRRNARVFHLSGLPAWLRNRAAGRAGGKTMHHLFRYDALNAINEGSS